MSEQFISKQKVHELLTKRRDALLVLQPHRKAIEEAAMGRAMLPENNVLRAMCAYIAGDFATFVDGTIRDHG